MFSSHSWGVNMCFVVAFFWTPFPSLVFFKVSVMRFKIVLIMNPIHIGSGLTILNN